MGRSIICNYELQVGNEERVLRMGGMSFEESVKEVLSEMKRTNSPLGMIWPQTQKAKDYIVRNYAGSDYVKITPEGKRIGITMSFDLIPQ